ncbi:MAG: hypothetical protein R6U11_05980 [Bacteroidales bacterium]
MKFINRITILFVLLFSAIIGRAEQPIGNEWINLDNREDEGRGANKN